MAENKKNLIPLVLAVILAMAAVFAVHRLIQRRAPAGGEDLTAVVVASRNLEAGEMIDAAALTSKVIPRTAAPSKAIAWKQNSMILNQKLKNPVSRGDYIVFDDIGVGGGLSDMIGDGEWAVPISLNGGAITSRLRPGDEIAVIGTFTLTEKKKSVVAGQDARETSRKITTVILPKVRILALDGNNQQGGDQFVLALPPKQAQMLLAAQEQGISLSPALRKQHDENNLNRIDAGLVDAETFNNLAQGIERTLIPVAPAKK